MTVKLPSLIAAAVLVVGFVGVKNAVNAQPSDQCIPHCVCVVGEGCPCCHTEWPIAILESNQEANRDALKIISEIMESDPAMLNDMRKRLRVQALPQGRKDQEVYYTRLALLYLPKRKAERLGIAEAAADGGIDVPFEYIAYAACFYGGWAGGGDVVEVGDDCKNEWID